MVSGEQRFVPKSAKFKPESIPPGSWKKVEVICGEHRSKAKTVNFVQIYQEHEMVSEAYARLHNDGSTHNCPGSSHKIPEEFPKTSCFVDASCSISGISTPSTSEKMPSKISERTPRLKAWSWPESWTSPIKIIEATASSTHNAESVQGCADTEERPAATDGKRKRCHTPEPIVDAEARHPAKKRPVQKAQAALKVKIGPIRSSFVKLL